MKKPKPDTEDYCPLWRKKMRNCCDTCGWFIPVSGGDPQRPLAVKTEWMCAITAQVVCTYHAGQSASNATQELRNDLHHERKAQTRLLARSALPLGAADEHLRIEDNGQDSP